MRSLRAVSRLALLATLVASAGCGGFWRSWSVAPNGLAKSEDRLRRDLASARYDDALERIAPDGDASPDDELLRLLYDGVVAHYADRYRESADALDRAAALADDRYTLSASRGALSLVSSDRSLQFRPNRTERLLIHYYGALNYLQRADVEGAAVEARRLSALLQRYGDDGWDCEGTRLCATLRYFAGAVFETAGERDDADVAYRNAAMIVERLSPATPADSGEDAGRGPSVGARGAAGSTAPYDSATGEVLLLLERGFVAHRVEESVTVVLGADEAAAMSAGDAGDRLAVSTIVAARLLGESLDEPVRGRRSAVTVNVRSDDDEDREEECERDRRSDRDRRADDECERDPNPYILRVAWPKYRDEYEPWDRAVLSSPDGRRAEAPPLANVSAAVMGEFADERLEVVARAVARAAAKFATVRAVESEVAEENDGLGRVLGLLTNIGGVLLERADTRSWHLLPDAIGIARMRLPPGSHSLELALSDGRGRGSRRIPIGPVEVRTGTITVVSARVWH